jgi:peptidyl-prolyl cis-trans isomerase A (cyclophilin A)
VTAFLRRFPLRDFGSAGIAIVLLLGLSDGLGAQRSPHVLIRTSVGRIEVEIDTARAPISGGNFLRYVDGGRYAKGRFYRTVTLHNQGDNPVRIEVIQGGRDPATPSFGFIPLERTSRTGLRHRDGTISMARAGPGTATSEFFICIGDQPELDFGGRRNPDGQGFAAFGRVVRGMDVVRKVQQSPANGQALTPPIMIEGITRVASPH